ncbi:MAG: bifunctional phosphoribosylaminoimidazolecarboxamide formyltransferase/IMP cyclohydrolase [Candidatus Thermoplasmatota archaeon]|nr:bifunctional phosphoribosylaminoimidazolecarboxamide formyltransferase/IMP cyclohydrolase [Candidatus Thermoplasmatota archaeon]
MAGKKRYALVSVSDKDGIDGFCRGLKANGYEMISSGGTYKYLRERGIDCLTVEDITGFPEILDGRVKTLHPKVFGGLLGRRDLETHVSQMRENSIPEIDLVVVNLYPFEKTVAEKDVSLEEAIEQIDIGGPSLVRAAAKNHRHVTVVVDAADHDRVLSEIRMNGEVGAELRAELALKAFQLTSSYDTAIHNWLQKRFHPELPWGSSLRMSFEKVMETRYGENPHQKGAYFEDPGYDGVSVHTSKVLWGKELSFNNIYDIDAVLDILMEFPGDPCCAIIKHNNPSGVAIGSPGAKSRIADAFERAFNCDPISAYGGIIGLNRHCDLETAERINQRFFEVVIAPSFEEGALKELMRKKNLRIIRTDRPVINNIPPEHRIVKVKGGLLMQTMSWPEMDTSQWKVVSSKEPTDDDLKDMAFATRVVKHVKSNCVVLARDNCTVGVGAGQMSRVDSCFMAGRKAGERAKGSVLSSDAFFPFRDGIDTVADVGVVGIAQPGGSIRDDEVIRAVDEHGMSMVFTGVRLFKH